MKKPPRVSLLPHRNEWSEIEREAVAVVESFIAKRGRCRPGDVANVPLTIGHVQLWLRKTGARRRGRDYARDVLATLVRMNLLRDTGRVLTPSRQPDRRGRSYWWRVWEVVPVKRVTWLGAYPSRSAPPSTGSLRRFLSCQGLLQKPRGRKNFRDGSVQAAFWATGPP